jgi:hypothetical protein
MMQTRPATARSVAATCSVMFAIGWNPDAPHKKRVELDINYQLGAGLKVMGPT